MQNVREAIKMRRSSGLKAQQCEFEGQDAKQ
jgi:hypothetical protein